MTEFKKPVPESRTIVPGNWSDILDDWASSFFTDSNGDISLKVFGPDYLFEISAGRVPGSTSGFLVGINENILSSASHTVSDQGGVYSYLPANTQLALSSSNSGDTAITVALAGLDEDYNPVSMIASTNGTDGQIQSNFSSAQAFRIDTATVISPASPNGQLYISEVTTTVAGKPTDLTKIKAQIPLITDTTGSVIDIGTDTPSTNITHLGLVTVPAGKRMFITTIIGSVSKNGNMKLTGRVRPPGGAFRFLSRNPASVYQSNVIINFNPPLVIQEKWDLEFVAVGGSDGTFGQVQMFFVFEDM